jgi:tetratricopeptide (TPR) repeat protein
MLKKTTQPLSRTENEIMITKSDSQNHNFLDIINQQIYHTSSKNYNILQKIQHDIYFLSCKGKGAQAIKKLSDQAQYGLLPSLHEEEPFYKISFVSLKNQCHIFGENVTEMGMIDPLDTKLFFYFHIGNLEDALHAAIDEARFFVREILTNRTIIISDGTFNFPLIISKVPSLAIWRNEAVELVIKKELSAIKLKAKLCQKVFAHLEKHFGHFDWQLKDGLMSYYQNQERKSFDYIGLIDDMHFCGYQDIEEYLKYFNPFDQASFPTVAVRSLVHLKARPTGLSRTEHGYAIVAAIENGTQTMIETEKPDEKAFSLWLKRTARHVPRHRYQARVVFSPDNQTFSLVGEQAATIALFPNLLRGLFDALNLQIPKSVRLIAHNEDVLTIAHDGASWIDINSTNKKATNLFRLVSPDGADPLSLFEHVLMPAVGVGNFNLQVVPEQFFELFETATSLRHAMAPGHEHYLLGLAFQCIHEWGLAVIELQKALRLDNNDPDILHALGCSLMEASQVKQAVPFLKKACELMPDDPELANNWGRGSLESGDIPQAIDAFERAVKLNPACADYLNNLGNGYLLAKRPFEALDILNKALRCDPHFAEAHASLAHLHLQTGDHLQAEKHALLAYKENPSDTNIANLLWRLTLAKK